MELTWDDDKRRRTIEARGLDFQDATKVFSGKSLTIEDDRRDYGESRYQTIGCLGQKVVMVVWTPRDSLCRIISMRVCDAEEREQYRIFVDRS